MNYRLEQLIKETTLLSSKDIYEIRQMFTIFDSTKKINMLNNWDNMIVRIVRLKEWMKKEQEILLWKAIDTIEKQIEKAKINWYAKWSWDELSQLKQMI